MKQYIIDAFTDKVFSGNPAAICILDEWLSDDTMLLIARENNLSETAFAVKGEGNHYKLRWFTPGGEIDLCGHATLACAFVIMNYYEKNLKTVIFDTLSGKLTVNRKNGDLYELDFPAYDLKKVEITDKMIELIGKKPAEAYLGRDLMCIFDDEDFILSADLDSEKIKKLDGLLLHITAQHSNYSLNFKINRLYFSFLCSKIKCLRRSCLRLWALPYCSLLDGKTAKGKFNRLSGFRTKRNTLLHSSR